LAVLRGQPASLVRVNGSRTLLISAYLEHRTRTKKVCWFRVTELHVSRASVDIHWDHFGFPYGMADVSCPLPPACQAPTHVAVTSAAIRNPGTAALTCFVLQLVQSLEMLQFLGVNRVVVYKTNCSAETQRVLDYYSDKGLVEVVPWSLSEYLKVSRRAKPDQDPGDIHYFGQIPALNDCLYRSMYRSKYVALHDPDEFILPQTVNSEFALTPPAPQTLPQLDRWQNVSGVNILNHVYIEPAPQKPVFNNYKIITNPRSVYSVTVHGVLRSRGSKAVTDCILCCRPRRQTELKPEQLIYDGRLLKYSGRLVSAVNGVLRDNGLLPKDAM
uniref:Glycosyltransferase family 92 protein n=1 Tax=Poecilia latipinna TaxID=48699 RepID=A0A3B3TQS4_9TELE